LVVIIITTIANNIVVISISNFPNYPIVFKHLCIVASGCQLEQVMKN
jgi:hypothetical protein